ncbi:MAG: radical SAM protein [Bdellovibrionales bacterium]|nr:radical SAM protein [Bdellovibrionales bacterium]
MKNEDFIQIPFDRIDRVGQRSLLNRDLFCVSWILGRFCNYSCSYCWPYAHSNKPDHRPVELVKGTIDEIKRQATNRGFRSFHFSFSGGEPTANPKFLDIISHYASDRDKMNYLSTHMTSNCSPSIKWYKRYVEATKELDRVSITASYHSEFAKKDIFAEKLLFLQENGVNITINMVMVPERFDMLWETALFFHEQEINVTLKPQSNPNATKVVDGYTEEQLLRLRTGMPQMDFTGKHSKVKKAVDPNRLPPSDFKPPAPKPNTPKKSDDGYVSPVLQVELMDDSGKKWYMDQAERFNAFNFNQFKGWECSAGYRSIIIREPDGTIKRSYSCHDEPLGHIDTGFQLFPKVMPCVTPSCVSSADSKIPKRKPGTGLPLWPQKVTSNTQQTRGGAPDVMA